MSFLQLFGLSFLQGLTEFLPISSSGHLILFAKFSGFADQGVSIDIFLHFGSLLAVLIYFRKTVAQMLYGLFQNRFLPNFKNDGNRLAYLTALATLPILIAGLALHEYGMETFRRPEIIGITILFYGIVLYVADRFGTTKKTLNDLTIKDALWIGLAQCLALIPGTSRSGITITMARGLGFNRTESAKFSMLLAMPTIFSATVFELWELSQDMPEHLLADGTQATVLSFAFSIIVIAFMMKWLKTATYLPFVIYRIVLGLLLLGHAFF